MKIIYRVKEVFSILNVVLVITCLWSAKFIKLHTQEKKEKDIKNSIQTSQGFIFLKYKEL